MIVDKLFSGGEVMDIPGLITPFGEVNGAIIGTLVKDVKFKNSDLKKQRINVFLDLDLDEEKIKFQIIDYKDDSNTAYNYCGNNPAAGLQFFPVRDLAGFKNYWQGRMKGVFLNLIDFLNPGELKEMLKEGWEKGLFGEQGLCFDKMEWHSGVPGKYVYDYQDKAIKTENPDTGLIDKISYEKFMSQILDIGQNVKIDLIIPRIIKNGQAHVISTHEDYINRLAEFFGGGDSGKSGVCHICGKKKSDINTIEYSTKFNKSGIGKAYVTTTVNYAPYFNKLAHQQNYSICKECYEKFMQGEKEVLQKFRLRIANEDCVLLFEGLDKIINRSYLPETKNKIDLVFNPKNSNEWAMQFQRELNKKQQIELYQFNMVFYKTDGKSTAIKKTIENISSIRFDQVIKAFDTGGMRLNEYLRNFTIGHVYTLMPVNKDKKGKQINIHRILDLYSAIIKNQRIERKYIFELYGEGMTRLVNELRASKIRNYENIISYRPKVSGKTTGFELDINIKEYTLKYLAFIHSLEELKLLDKEVKNLAKQDDLINEEEEQNQVVDFIAERERFLEEQGFSNAAKGLFYMGALLYEIGSAQYKQKHKNKPILDKLDYGGMDDKAVIMLYTQDVLEKLRQYAKHINPYRCDAYKKMLHEYLGTYGNLKSLSHQEAVFYLMAGYSYSVSLIKKRGVTADQTLTDMDETIDE